MRSRSVRLRSPLLALALVGLSLAAAPKAQAQDFWFLGGYNSGIWSDLNNWLGGTNPLSPSYDPYSAIVHLGHSDRTGALASVMNYGPVALKGLAFDQGGSVSLTGDTLLLAGGGLASGGFVSAGTGTYTVANGLALNGNGAADGATRFSVLAGGTLASTGSISGAASLVKTGAGLLVLAGDNSYTGGTTLREGTVWANSNGALAGGDLTLAGGVLILNGSSPTVRDLNLGDGQTAGDVGTVFSPDPSKALNLMGDVTFNGRSDRTTAPAGVYTNLALSSGQHAFGGGSRSTGQPGPIDAIVSGVISGSGGVDKTGATWFALVQRNTYAGPTNVRGGALFLGVENALPTSTALTINAGTVVYSSFDFSQEGGVTKGAYSQTVASLAGGGTIYPGASTLTVGDATSTTFSGRLYGTGLQLVKQGAGTLTLTGNANRVSGGTTIKGGAIRIGANRALGGPGPGAGTGTADEFGDLALSGGALDLNGYSPTVRNLYLGDGAATSIGAITGAGTLNLYGDLTVNGKSSVVNGSTVLQTAPFQTGANLALSAGQHVFGDISNTLNSQICDVTLSGVLSGPGGLTKGGAPVGFFSSLGLAGKNTYQGPTSIQDRGWLLMGTENALPATTALTVGAGSSLILNPWLNDNGLTAGSYSQTVGSLSGSGLITLGAATLTVGGNNANTEFSGTIYNIGYVGQTQNDGTLVKTGAGTLTLSGVGAAAHTTIRNGAIRAGSDSALNLGDLVLSGGALDLNGYSPSVRNLSLVSITWGSPLSVMQGAGTLNLYGNLDYAGRSDGASPLVYVNSAISLQSQARFTRSGASSSNTDADYDLVGALAGPGGLTVDGARVILQGRSTYAGPTVVQSGSLAPYAQADLLPVATALTVNGSGLFALNGVRSLGGYSSQTVGSLSGNGTVSLGSATLTVGGNNADTAFSGRIVHNTAQTSNDRDGKLVKVGMGTLTLTGANDYGDTALYGGTLVGTTSSLHRGINDLSHLVFDQAFDGAFDGFIAGNGTLTKRGSGTVTMTRPDHLVYFGGALDVQGGTLVTNVANFDRAVEIGTDGTLALDQQAGATYHGALAGTGTLAKLGGGTLRIGDQAFAGRTSVRGGTLSVLAGRQYRSDRGVSVAAGATLRLNSSDTLLGGASFQNAGTLSGSGEIDAALTNAATGKVQVGPADRLVFDQGVANAGTLQLDGGEIDVAGALTNAAGSFVTGRGVLSAGSILSAGMMAFTGATDVHGDLSLASGAKVQTSGGATLTFWDDVTHNGAEVRTNAGSTTTFKGSVNGAGSYTGLGTVEFDGDLRPGNSPAAVRFDGSLVLGDASTTVMELGGTALGAGYDHLTVGGTAFLGGALDVVWYGGFSAGLGQSFDLFDFGSSSGAFASVSLPTLGNGLVWNTSALYTTGVVKVQAVPEPTSLLALGVGAAAVLRRRRTPNAERS